QFFRRRAAPRRCHGKRLRCLRYIWPQMLGVFRLIECLVNRLSAETMTFFREVSGAVGKIKTANFLRLHFFGLDITAEGEELDVLLLGESGEFALGLQVIVIPDLHRPIAPL